MPFLNLDLDYEDHPKTRRLVGLLGRGSEILPIRVWIYCGKYHARDGRFTGYSPQEIEAVLKWWGPSGQALRALTGTRFLERDGEGYRVHDWKTHQGHIQALKTRNKKVAVNRWKKIKEVGFTVDTSGIPKSTSGVPQAFPSLPTNQPNRESKAEVASVRADFKPPSVKQVRDHGGIRGFAIDAEKFVAHFTAVGWIDAQGRKIVNWRALVDKWRLDQLDRDQDKISREKARGGPNGRTGGTVAPTRPGKYD